MAVKERGKWKIQERWNQDAAKRVLAEGECFNRGMCLESPRADRSGCTTTKAGCSPTARTCATAWMGTAWAASTPAPSAAHASAAWSAAATGSGFTSKWRWRVAKSSGTSMLFSCGPPEGFGDLALRMGPLWDRVVFGWETLLDQFEEGRWCFLLFIKMRLVSYIHGWINTCRLSGTETSWRIMYKVFVLLE